MIPNTSSLQEQQNLEPQDDHSRDADAHGDEHKANQGPTENKLRKIYTLAQGGVGPRIDRMGETVNGAPHLQAIQDNWQKDSKGFYKLNEGIATMAWEILTTKGKRDRMCVNG